MWLAPCSDGKYRAGERALELAQQSHNREWSNKHALKALTAAYVELGQYQNAVVLQEHVLQDPQLANDAAVCARFDLYREEMPYRQE